MAENNKSYNGESLIHRFKSSYKYTSVWDSFSFADQLSLEFVPVQPNCLYEKIEAHLLYFMNEALGGNSEIFPNEHSCGSHRTK